mgnify:CR=1 FL=1
MLERIDVETRIERWRDAEPIAERLAGAPSATWLATSRSSVKSAASVSWSPPISSVVDYVAREVIQAEDIVDFTQKENLAEKFARRFGAGPQWHDDEIGVEDAESPYVEIATASN